ncbi:hypothetical protein [Syntrophorhabdus aromaticivorans]|uniref:hypothetical protein n=1 Tax=Syntrophorhabdus aromaticivorans TaxID=328301 RepID=UPI000423DFEE|nr:hypothetical protein [Syntrophorhabdus aromaticivorans]
MSRKRKKTFPVDFGELERYFQIGVSKNYILLRDDFPISTIAPGEFKALLLRMFDKNDEVLNHGK